MEHLKYHRLPLAAQLDAKAVQPQPKCKILSLPAEIRLMIWKLVLKPYTAYRDEFSRESRLWRPDARGPETSDTSLIKTCAMVYLETWDLVIRLQPMRVRDRMGIDGQKLWKDDLVWIEQGRPQAWQVLLISRFEGSFQQYQLEQEDQGKGMAWWANRISLKKDLARRIVLQLVANQQKQGQRVDLAIIQRICDCSIDQLTIRLTREDWWSWNRMPMKRQVSGRGLGPREPAEGERWNQCKGRGDQTVPNATQALTEEDWLPDDYGVDILRLKQIHPETWTSGDNGGIFSQNLCLRFILEIFASKHMQLERVVQDMMEWKLEMPPTAQNSRRYSLFSSESEEFSNDGSLPSESEDFTKYNLLQSESVADSQGAVKRNLAWDQVPPETYHWRRPRSSRIELEMLRWDLWPEMDAVTGLAVTKTISFVLVSAARRADQL